MRTKARPSTSFNTGNCRSSTSSGKPPASDTKSPKYPRQPNKEEFLGRYFNFASYASPAVGTTNLAPDHQGILVKIPTGGCSSAFSDPRASIFGQKKLVTDISPHLAVQLPSIYDLSRTFVRHFRRGRYAGTSR